MPYIIIGFVAAVLIAGTVVVARVMWRKQVGRYIIALTGHREAIVSALKAAESVIAELAQGDAEQIMAFSAGGSDERQTLAEIAERMRIEHAELTDIALPKKLWKFADMLCDAAESLATQAGGVGDQEGEAVLDALLELDLASVRGLLADSAVEAERVSVQYKVTDPSVYGGGLYI
jgi:hypothetical protein